MSKRSVICSVPLFILLIIPQIQTKNVEVKLEQGIISGQVERTFFDQTEYFSFIGIPYGEPPIGELRFQPPRKHVSWSGTLEAYENKPTCMQFNYKMRNGEAYGISGSEDCLYINVFTPALQESAPVVVFDYNYSFKTGFNGTDTYSTDPFIEENVVVVTIYYRLGVLGYLSTADDVIPQNNGLRDFVLGLEWVRDNIERFGGDPKHVVLMGNQGGAIIANILLYSEKAKGLFSGIIMQSGTIMEPIHLSNDVVWEANQIAKAFNIEANDSDTLLRKLQQIEAEEIIQNERQAIDSKFEEIYQISSIPFMPTIENNPNGIFTISPDKGKIVNDVPVIIGLTSREGLDLASNFLIEPKLMENVVDYFSLHLPIRSNFRFNTSNNDLYELATNEIRNQYFQDGYISNKNTLQYADYLGDVFLNYAVEKTAEKLVNSIKSPVYYYMFDFRGMLNENFAYISRKARASLENWGATVTDELCYLLLCSRIMRNYKDLTKQPSKATEFKVLKKMVRLWTNFAKTGNPTPNKEDNLLKNFVWEPLKSSKESNFAHLSKNFAMKTYPLGSRTKFWDDFLKKYSDIAVDGVVKGSSHDEL